MLALLVALALSQTATTLAQPPPRAFTVTDFAALLNNISSDCDCAALSLTDGTSVTTTRASSAICTKNDGTLTACTSNLPRVNSTGLLVEAGRTNSLLHNDEMDDAAWDDTLTPAVTANTWDFGLGSSTGETINDNDGAGSEGRGQTISTATTGAWTCSVYARSGTLTAFRFVVTVTGGTGTATCSKSGLSSTTSRQQCTVQAGAGVSAIRCEIQPGANDAATGTVLIGGAQLEAGSPATSYIATTTATVARAADSISFVPSVDNSTVGCLGYTVVQALTGTFGLVAMSGNGSSTWLGRNSSGTNMQIADGTNFHQVAADGSDISGKTIAIRCGWGGSTMSITAGATTTTGAFDGNMTMTAVYLGSDKNTTHINGHVRALKIGANAAGCQP